MYNDGLANWSVFIAPLPKNVALGLVVLGAVGRFLPLRQRVSVLVVVEPLVGDQGSRAVVGDGLSQSAVLIRQCYSSRYSAAVAGRVVVEENACMPYCWLRLP